MIKNKPLLSKSKNHGIEYKVSLLSTMPVPTYNNTCSIVVLYYPSIDFIDINLQRLLNLSQQQVIVINGIAEQTQTQLNRQLHNRKKTHIIKIFDNPGLGVALNHAATKAIQQGCSWLLFFDQDSLVEPNILQTYQQIYIQLPDNLGLLGCNYYDQHKQGSRYKERPKVSEVKTLITSGSLISTQQYQQLGPFRSDYFIDSLDHEYCLRARQQGLSNWRVNQCLMNHCIGEPLNQQGFSKIQSYNHNALRKFTMTRNTIATVKTYAGTEFLWSIKQVFRLVFEMTSCLLFEKNKQQKLRAMFTGAMAGWKNDFQYPGKWT